MSDRRAEIVALGIKNGTVVCNAEDLDTPNITHRNVVISKSMGSKVKVPSIGSEAIISEMYDGQKYVDGVISTPGHDGGSSMEEGSISLVFDEEGSEKILIEASDSGYNIKLDIDGDIEVSTEGNVDVDAAGEVKVTGSSGVKIDEGGKPKKVATEDHTHEYDWTNSSGSGTTSKPDEVTESEIE